MRLVRRRSGYATLLRGRNTTVVLDIPDTVADDIRSTLVGNGDTGTAHVPDLVLTIRVRKVRHRLEARGLRTEERAGAYRRDTVAEAVNPVPLEEVPLVRQRVRADLTTVDHVRHRVAEHDTGGDLLIEICNPAELVEGTIIRRDRDPLRAVEVAGGRHDLDVADRVVRRATSEVERNVEVARTGVLQREAELVIRATIEDHVTVRIMVLHLTEHEADT